MPKETKFKKLMRTALRIMGVALLLVILGFVNGERKEKICWNLEVKVDRQDGSYFVDEDEIKKAILALGDSLVGSRISDVDVQIVRSTVAKMPAVRSADVYKTVDGRIQVNVKQCQPLVRIINSDGTGFYLDKDGGTAPLSKKFTARVPVVVGAINEPLGLSVHALRLNQELADQSCLDEIFSLFEYIEDDEFLSAQVDHVYRNQFGEYTIIPRVGNHNIQIGEVNNLDQKFGKLMAFYQQNIGKRDLNKYTDIDLRYRKQVVCRKRSY